MILDESEIRDELIRQISRQLMITARTAPKAKGEDSLEILYVDGEEKERIAEKMVEMKDRHKDFVRDAEGVKKAQAVLLIGVFGDRVIGLNCGACGLTCDEMKKAEKKEGKDYRGPMCAYKLIDLGIALGSVAKLASIMGVDNRIMYRIGTAARKLGYAKADIVMGIPLTSAGKNPFFDRK
ncbi:Uncharacterized protein containing a ferredoxin domain [Archaeoglobus sulfaticallidus PM70-1]|uniref:Uncharacterized protein containing a ferredoxin domain n=1 Tax=Archaeoglobus sulfaticallidus PM70-1 TaxID=387631 RepID=N0BE21_9EURY|nr:DUF2148 domain-containing protein [Archaeoglobus sulfaticallidus]AGK60467.1 Uncharacterized protein containing a ferredoxin domain [Archaeoglobus sulfaticallidus PM70-1]